jgi:hypothetical protein
MSCIAWVRLCILRRFSNCSCPLFRRPYSIYALDDPFNDISPYEPKAHQESTTTEDRFEVDVITKAAKVYSKKLM